MHAGQFAGYIRASQPDLSGRRWIMDPWAHDADTPGAVMENASGGEVREAAFASPLACFFSPSPLRGEARGEGRDIEFV